MRDLGAVAVFIDTKCVVVTLALRSFLPHSLLPLLSQTPLIDLGLAHIATLKMTPLMAPGAAELKGEASCVCVRVCAVGGRHLTVPFAQQSWTFHLWS